MHPRLVVALAGLGALDLGYIDFILGPRLFPADPAAARIAIAAPSAPMRHTTPEVPTLPPPASDAPVAAAAPPAPAEAEGRRGPPGETWWIVNFPVAGQATLSEAAEQQLAQIAARFAKSHDVRINIVGHADERGGDELNDQLGTLRARAVARALERAGFNPEQVAVGSRGEAAPAVLGSDPDAWAANRRVEIEIVTVAKPKPTGVSTP